METVWDLLEELLIKWTGWKKKFYGKRLMITKWTDDDYYESINY